MIVEAHPLLFSVLMKTPFLALSSLVALVLVGCGGTDEPEPGSTEENYSESDAKQIAAELRRCPNRNNCSALAKGREMIQSKLKAADQAHTTIGGSWIVTTGICGNAVFGGGVAGCADYTWSFGHKQSAGFAIVAGKLGLPTINVEKYVGVAKANNKGSSIISMWSGPFSSVEYSASGGWFGGSAQYFNSPDGNIHGGALSVNVGLSLPKPPGASNAFEKVILKLAGLGASFTCYTPWDDYTKKFESLDGTGYYGSSKCGEAGSGKYTQFSSYMTMYAQMVVYGIMEVPALVATLIETALK